MLSLWNGLFLLFFWWGGSWLGWLVGFCWVFGGLGLVLAYFGGCVLVKKDFKGSFEFGQAGWFC